MLLLGTHSVQSHMDNGAASRTPKTRRRDIGSVQSSTRYIS